MRSEVLEEFTDEIIDLYFALKKEKESFKDLGIDIEEKAFYDILKALAIKYDFDYPDDKLIELAKKVKGVIDDKSKYTDWSKRKPYRGEFCNKAKDGTLYWLDTTVIPFLDRHGKIYQHLSINQDITERKLTEEKLKKSEGMNRAMIENTSNGLVLLDSDLSYVYQSPSVERITGYSFKNRKTKTASELIFPDDLKLVQETME